MRGFSSMIGMLAGLFGVKSALSMLGPSAPIAGSSFRKRGRNHKKMMKNPPNRTGWFQRHADIAPMVITERMLLRHGWYRRKLRKQGVPLVEGVLNAVMLR